jgi:septal ring factor EnvC (AmiA/AmiB activator)
MTQLNDEHFELHDQNKAERYERQKIKFLEDRIKVLETAIESHAKILARFQMTEDKDNNEVPEWVTTTGKMRNT